MPEPDEEGDCVEVNDGVDDVVDVAEPLEVGGLVADVERVTLELAVVD